MDDPLIFRGKAWLLRRNWAVLLGSCSAGILGAATILIAGGLHGALAAIAGVIAIMAICVAPFVIAYTWFANPRPVRRAGDVLAGPPGVSFRGRLLLPRESIRAGFTIPHEHGVIVQLERRFFRPIELLFPTAEAARAMLRSLGLDASQTAVSVPLRSLAAIDWRRFIPGLSLGGLGVGWMFAFVVTNSPAVAIVVGLLALLGF